MKVFLSCLFFVLWFAFGWWLGLNLGEYLWAKRTHSHKEYLND